mgnify:CR=1 FL=1
MSTGATAQTNKRADARTHDAQLSESTFLGRGAGRVPELDGDAIGAVLGAIVDEDHWVTRRTAAAWCAVSKAHRDACYEAEAVWSALTALHFSHVRTLDPDCARANYNAIYNLIRAYGETGVRIADAPIADKKTKLFVLAALRFHGNQLCDVPEFWYADRDVILAAAEGQYVLHRRDILERFRDDREVVLGIVRRSGRALEYVSRRLRDDREVVLTAVRQSGYAHRFASPQLFVDWEVVAEARATGRRSRRWLEPWSRW